MNTAEHPLIQYRKASQLTQIGLAEKLGVSKFTIIRWENWSFLIPVKRLDDISRTTGIPREELRPDIFRPTPAHMDAAS